MSASKEKESRRIAEEERQRGAELAAQAKDISAILPEEQEALTTGIGRLGEITSLALQPERVTGAFEPLARGLVTSLTQQALESSLIPEFQRRGLTTSGLLPEAGSRAAVNQAIGVSNLVLGQALNFLQTGLSGAQALTGVGETARGRQVSGGLTGLGFQQTAQGRALGVEESALQRAQASQQALGAGVGTLLGTGAQLALLPQTAVTQPTLSAAQLERQLNQMRGGFQVPSLTTSSIFG